MGKGGRWLGLTLRSSCSDRLEIWVSLNLLECSGNVQACIGIDLPLPLQFNKKIVAQYFTC
jgi:hypothetical protein